MLSTIERIQCFRHTLRFSEEDEVLRKYTEYLKSYTKVYAENYYSENKRINFDSAEIVVEENTTFSAAGNHRWYKDTYENYVEGRTAVLNFANPHNPGGGVLSGAMAQEECLCRSSNLYKSLTSPTAMEYYYQYNRKLQGYLFSDQVIYSPDVIVFKTDDAIPQLMSSDRWFQIDVITCAAPIKKLKYTDKILLDVFESRIQNIFEVAKENNVEILILGAFGCGAFGNPPEVVARAFHNVCERYQNNFRKIVFAIKRTTNHFKDCPNIAAFENEFYGK